MLISVLNEIALVFYKVTGTYENGYVRSNCDWRISSVFAAIVTKCEA